MDAPLEPLPPGLQNVVDQRSLKWVFVGGKGGVGKTTVSCCLAIELSKSRTNVLLISTDPAHNLSDAFGQKFTKAPSKVTGFTNLFAMEIDPTAEDELEDDATQSEDKKLFQGLATAMPGIDEAMSFNKIMTLVQSMEFDIVVFDTAPTGHTLRFLQFPQMLTKTFGKLFGAQGGVLGGLMSQMMTMMGGGGGDQMQGKMAKTQQVIEQISQQFQDPSLTTFVCVCIPEFLALYETERLLQELAKLNMDSRNILVNQILDPVAAQCCPYCRGKSVVQQNHLGQIDELYNGLYHITYLPAVTTEVRGVPALLEFSPLLMKPNAKLFRDASDNSDFARLAEECKRMTELGADWLHVDVMDGHFVPNLTIGAPVVASLRPHTKAFLDCHLMVSHPEKWVDDFAAAGANQVTFHIEATQDPEALIAKIKAKGMRAGVALKPGTDTSAVRRIAHLVDMVLVMTVEPGFGGQSFMDAPLAKVRELREAFPALDIEVDGGLSEKTIAVAAEAGANCIVAGNAIFKSTDAGASIRALRDAVDQERGRRSSGTTK